MAYPYNICDQGDIKTALLYHCTDQTTLCLFRAWLVRRAPDDLTAILTVGPNVSSAVPHFADRVKNLLSNSIIKIYRLCLLDLCFSKES